MMGNDDFIISSSAEAISDTDAPGIIRIDHEVVQERDTFGDVLPIDERIRVGPSRVPTEVRVRSATAANQLNSPTYVASVRRRKMQAIVKQIQDLEAVSGHDDFEMHALPVVESLRQCLFYLAEAQTEGNTREIIRLVRDSFMDGLWVNHRQADNREIALKILKQVADSDEVTPDMVYSAFDALDDSELLPELKLPVIDEEIEDNY